MKTQRIKNNYLAILGIIFFMAFAISALLDAQARILISDPALFLFKIISSKNLSVPADRYTSVINQPLLVFAVHAKLPLNYLIGIYSISFVLVRVLYYFIAAHVFRCQSAGYAVIFISIIGVAESYFRPTSESTIALLNSILFYAWLSYANMKNIDAKRMGEIFVFLISVLFVLFGYFSHPIALFSLIFVILYFTLKENKLKKIHPYLMVVFTLIIFLSKILKTSTTSSHHGELYSNILNNPLKALNEITTYYPYNFFWDRYDKLFLPVIILTVLALLLLLLKKKWYTSVFFTLYTIFYFIVTCVSFKEGESNMQMEKIFLPVTFFSGLVFLDFFILKFKKLYIVTIPLLLILMGHGFYQINKVRPIYRDRIDYLKTIVVAASKEKQQKFILPADSINKPRMVFHWASGIETLVLSTMEDSVRPLTVFITNDPENYEKQMNKKNNFICAPFHSNWVYDNINPHYFELPLEEYSYLQREFK